MGLWIWNCCKHFAIRDVWMTQHTKVFSLKFTLWKWNTPSNYKPCSYVILIVFFCIIFNMVVEGYHGWGFPACESRTQGATNSHSRMWQSQKVNLFSVLFLNNQHKLAAFYEKLKKETHSLIANSSQLTWLILNAEDISKSSLLDVQGFPSWYGDRCRTHCHGNVLSFLLRSWMSIPLFHSDLMQSA